MKKLLALLLTVTMLLGGVSAWAQEDEDEVQAMLPVLDSVMRAMVEMDCSYQPQDSAYFWMVLSLLAVNWGQDNLLCEIEENELKVPRQVMQEYASAAFLDYDDLLPIPAESETAMVRYDEAWDAYYVGLGDVGDSYTQIASVSQLEDGSTQVEVTMGSYDVPQMYTMQAVLAPNPYADGMADPVYLYSVSSASLA